MSSLAQRLHDRFQRRLAQETPDLQRALLLSWDRLIAQMSVTQMAALLESASLDRVIQTVLSDYAMDAAFARYRAQLQLTMQRTVPWAALALPTTEARVGVAFDVLNPRILSALRVLDSRVMQVVKDGTREAFRAFVEQGFRAGKAPAAIARAVKDWIGLAPNQLAAIDNFRTLLETGDRAALTRQLRDRRFDPTVKKATTPPTSATPGTPPVPPKPLTAPQIDKMVDAYRERMKAHNANVLAKTAAQDAMKLGNKATWIDAEAKGFVPRGSVRRRWIHLDAQPHPRPTHQAMQGQTVGLNEPYSNGDNYAGEHDPWNCHCLDAYSVAA